MTEFSCINCDMVFLSDDPDLCMECGEPLCEDCYDTSSYCSRCEEEL